VPNSIGTQLIVSGGKREEKGRKKGGKREEKGEEKWSGAKKVDWVIWS